ncbi:MAG: hypothetical protein E7K90_21520 [Hafnia alvei]|uniref:hypothetical protein n=1 Tax=Hafnia alvei TaxID=569 RepID=UPI00290BA189|nr:hypothetical protein [Hafnia alvei]MDU7483945.1 hypothetical protein [Hafnia alvei]
MSNIYRHTKKICMILLSIALLLFSLKYYASGAKIKEIQIGDILNLITLFIAIYGLILARDWITEKYNTENFSRCMLFLDSIREIPFKSIALERFLKSDVDYLNSTMDHSNISNNKTRILLINSTYSANYRELILSNSKSLSLFSSVKSLIADQENCSYSKEITTSFTSALYCLPQAFEFDDVSNKFKINDTLLNSLAKTHSDDNKEKRERIQNLRVDEFFKL